MTTILDNEPFFAYWRRRVDNARWLHDELRSGARMLEPEIHILATAGLDALANYWAATFRPSLNGRGAPAGRRLHEFLCQHGDAQVFRKISAPDLVWRAHESASAVEPLARCHLGERITSGRVRYWEDDPDADVVLADDELVSAAPGRNVEEQARWVEKSRYAEILYSDLRCAWLHESNPSPSTSRAYEDEQGPPRYQNWLTGVPKRIVFPVAYLIRIFDAAVHSFETECVESGRSPVAP